MATDKDYAAILQGKTIARVRRMSRTELSGHMWSYSPLIIEFTDGTRIYPMSDSEGNSGGVLQYVGRTQDLTIPTL